MLKKIVLVVFSAFLSLACNTVPVIDGKMVVETDFKEVQPLRGTVCDLMIEGDPNHIYQVDSLLVVKDNNTDKSLFLYSEKDYKLVNNMLSRGRGRANSSFAGTCSVRILWSGYSICSWGGFPRMRQRILSLRPILPNSKQSRSTQWELPSRKK